MIPKLKPLWRGLSATFLSLLVVGSLGYGLADDWRSSLDNFLGTESYVVDDSQGGYFTSNYDTAEEMMAAAKEFAIKEGREGFVLMKNDNNALPLSKDKEIALFGAAAWAPYMQSTSLVGNCSDFGNRCKRGSWRGRNRSLDNFQLP